MTTKKIEQRFFILRDVLAIGIAIGISFLLVLSVSEEPGKAMSTFLIGPLQSVTRIGYIVEKMIPIMFTGVGVCLMFSAGQVNLGGEGSFYLGGVVSTMVAVWVALPLGLHPLVCIVAAGLTGALVCSITALFHVKFGALTIVTSLMLNYICLYTGQYLINNPLRDISAGYEASYRYAQTALLPKLFGRTNIHAGLFVAVAAVVFGHLLLTRSTFGYRMRMVGQNRQFAVYSGMPVASTIILCQTIGGFLAGMGGAVEQLGMYERFQYNGLPGHGFDGVMLAVIAGNNPKYIPLAAFILSYIRVGAESMQRMSDVPTEIVSIVQAIIIMFIVAEKFLSGMKHKAVVKNSIRGLRKTED